MHFTLEEHQVMVFDTLAALAADHLPMERLVSIFDAPDPYDRPFWEALMGLGMCGMLIPEAHGGSGLEMIDAAVALEALGHAAAPVPFAPHLLAGLVLARSGRAETWLPGLASGEVMGTLALGTGGWRPESWSLAPEGGTLSGTCAFVPAAGADPLVVVGLAGGGLGLVAPGANGVSQSPQDGIDRTRRLVEMRFENTPFTRLSDTPDLAETLLDASLVLQAADSFGGGRRVLEDTTRYAGERSQFGRTIGSFQAVKHQLADLALEVEPCRAVYWYAAHAFDHLPDEAAHVAALAKAHVADVYLQAARNAVELHGGIGFTWEFGLHIWLKRAMQNHAWGGAPDLHRRRQAALAGWA